MISNIIEKSLERLRKDNESGANEFIEMALDIVYTYLNSIDDEHKTITVPFLHLAKSIIDTRPSMAPLLNVFGFLIGDSNNITKKRILNNIKHFQEVKNTITQDIEKNFLKFIRDFYGSKGPTKVMLISYSSTIIRVLKKVRSKNIELYVLESRPMFEGRRTAKELSSFFETNLIIDAAFGYFIESMDVVLVGIDSILKDGTLINKIGTYPLAVLSHENDVDIYAVGNSLKYNLNLTSKVGKYFLV
ncbi:MAG: hypothetical protein R6U96_01565 [Promethearchaeia archaeon]